MERHYRRLERNTAGIVALAMAGALLTGCGALPGRDKPAETRIADVGATASQDGAITRSVRDQLARELPLAQIDVATAQGKVELRGTVEDSDAARRAVREALAVDGVRGVVNDLTVAPADAGGSGPSLSVATLD